MRILLVEDDEVLRRATASHLQQEGWRVDTAADGLEAQYLIQEGGYDAILLDRMLPGRDGLSLLRDLRAAGDATPVLLLTALAAVGDRVDGLDAGADDYLTKPFDPRELAARVRAMARRAVGGQGELRMGDLIYDPVSLVLRGAAGRCTLARKEGEFLEALLRRDGGTVSRAALFARLWGAGADVEEASLDSYAYYLRRRLASVSSRVSLVTVRGVGYRLEALPC